MANATQALNEVRDIIANSFTVEEVYTDSDITAYVKSNLAPQDVFDTNALEDWAEQNDYVKKDQQNY